MRLAPEHDDLITDTCNQARLIGMTPMTPMSLLHAVTTMFQTQLLRLCHYEHCPRQTCLQNHVEFSVTDIPHIYCYVPLFT